MDEQVIDDLYNRAVSSGYAKSREDFIQLLHSDNEVFDDMYSYVKEKGYGKTADDFSVLIGKNTLKKNESPNQPLAPMAQQESPVATESTGVGGLSESNTPRPLLKNINKPMPTMAQDATRVSKQPLTTSKKQDGQGIVGNVASSIDKGILIQGIGEPIKGAGTLLQGATKKLFGGTGKGFVSDALINFANYYEKIINDLTPQDKEFKGTLTDQFGQAFGQVAGMIATGGAAKVIGTAGKSATALEMAQIASKSAPTATGVSAILKTVGKDLAQPAAVSAGLAMGQSEFDRAKEAGATDEQAFNVFLKNATVGSVLETIPVMGFLKRFEKASVGGVTNYLKTKALGGLIGGTEEMTTEIMQQLYSNKTAQEVYNTNQDLFEGVAASGGVGFGVGFLINAMGANAKILRKEGKKAEADMVEKQMQEFEAQTQKGGPSSYKLNGISLQPDIAIPLIEKMDGADLAKANLEIVNDPELKIKVQEKIVSHSIKEQVRQGNPDLNEPSLNAITDLELALEKLEGNKTQTGKDKAAAIRTQIKDIQENQIQEEAKVATIEAEAPDVTAKRVDRIAELDTMLSPESTVTIEDTEKQKLQTELETLKSEQDAIQKQTTDEGLLRSQEPGLGLQEVGKGNAQPEGATAGTQNEILTDEEQKRKLALEDAFKNPNTENNTITIGEDIIPLQDAKDELNLLTNKELASTEAQAPAVEVSSKTPAVKQTTSEFATELKNKFGIELDLQENNDNKTVSLSKVVIPKAQRGKGIGTKIMEGITRFADENGKRLVLTPSTDFGGTSISRLTKFYKKFGFVENKGKNKDFTIKDTMYKNPIAEVALQEAELEIEQFEPITLNDIEVGKFTRNDALSYEEDERESDSGRMVPYLSSITVDVTDQNGDTIGEITKVTDSDKIFYFTVEDTNGNELNLDGYETLGDAKKALADNHNKIKQKEFNEEVKKKAKAEAKKTKVSPAIEEGVQVISAPLKIFKGSFGKRNIDGTVRTAHPNVKGVFGSTDVKIAERYSEVGESIQEFNIPEGATIETVQVKNTNQGLGAIREQETDLINNSKAQVVKLITIDAKGREEQYIIKDKSLLEKQAQKTETIDDLLDLDVTDQDNLDKVFEFLDSADKSLDKRLKGGANEAMFAIPLGITRVVIKALKALVQGGMLLRDAIKKVAADNNISQDTIKDIINIAPIQENFNSLMDKVDALIARQKKKGIEDSKITANIDTFVRKQDEYLNANDAQKKIIEREARGKMGAEPKRSVSIGRVLGSLKDITSISRKEKMFIIKQIRTLSKDAAKDLAKEIKGMATKGKITAFQAANIISRFGKVSMLSEISVSKFVDYMAKVFADAEYSSKLSQANSLKKDISKFSKDKNKDANLRDIGQQFIKIDPSMVEDIDSYNEMAANIKEAIKGSTIRVQKVTFANAVNIENASEYIAKTLATQDENIRLQKAQEIQDLMGIDVSELGYDDMMQLLDSEEPITKYKEGIIRDTIQKMFNIYSSIIDETIKTGKDQFNDEDVEFTKNQKTLIKKFMDMDLSLLSPKEALKTVDALANFLQNHSTAKMETVLREYTGNLNAKKLYEKGTVAQTLKKYWSEKFGRFLGERTTSLPVLFEKMFKGVNRGGEVQDDMAVTELANNKSKAEREANDIVDRYVSEFYKKQANGEAYNTEYNMVERGMAAFMMRTVIGTANQMQEDFNRRKGLILKVDAQGNRTGSIAELEKGNEQEQKKAELYQKVYDKILKDSESIQDVKDKTDATNLEGVDFWMNEWSDKYEQLSDVSQNIYNKVLAKELNYSPDRFVKLSSDSGVVELSNDDSAFHNNNGAIYKKESSGLMVATHPEKLPVNPKSGQTSRYIDLSFDKNNANSMYDALVDIGTAAPIRQIEAFLNSSYFTKIVPKSEDATVLKDRIKLYVGNIRNKNPYSNDELSAVVRGINKLANIGVGQALGGILQPIKQVIPVAMNTLVNAGNLDMNAMFNAAKNGFINRVGHSVSNRGMESQAQVESLNKLIDEASKSKGEALVKNIEKLNKWWLEKFLVNPDVFIARASWMTYYEQSLKKQGIDTNGIDYNTHEENEKASNYATRMVDRQQNISDADLSGKMFSNKEASNQILIKALMPFASFRMNQSARLGADLAVLSDKTATVEDRKIAIRSVAGFGVELATFKLIAAGSSILLGSFARWAFDRDEDDKEYKKRFNNAFKGQITSAFTDLFSPLPILDKAYQAGGDFLTDSLLGIPKESPFSIYNVPKQDYLQNLGIFGISLERGLQLYDISKLAATGEYTDNFGKVKKISEKDKKTLGSIILPLAVLSNVGLAPVEVNTIVRDIVKDIKKAPKKSLEEIEATQKRKLKTQEDDNIKMEVLDKLREDASSQEELDAIDEKINALQASSEEKKAIDEVKKAEREIKRGLLTDPETGEEYDNESKLKRYNPSLYNENFGPESEWYQEHEQEKIVEKKLNEEIRNMEDIEHEYVVPKRKSRKNSDGTLKRGRN